MDDKTLVIRNFVYDGEGPDAFFTVGVRTRKPNPKDATPIRLILIDLKFLYRVRHMCKPQTFFINGLFTYLHNSDNTDTG